MDIDGKIQPLFKIRKEKFSFMCKSRANKKGSED